jgi:mRNA interferase MazF
MAEGLIRGEVRLVRFPPPDKERSVLLLTRQTSLEVLSRVTVAPITSTIRGVPSEVVLGTADGMKQPCAVNVHNLITLRQDQLGRRVTLLGPAKMREVCAAIAFAMGCDA